MAHTARGVTLMRAPLACELELAAAAMRCPSEARGCTGVLKALAQVAPTSKGLLLSHPAYCCATDCACSWGGWGITQETSFRPNKLQDGLSAQVFAVQDDKQPSVCFPWPHIGWEALGWVGICQAMCQGQGKLAVVSDLPRAHTPAHLRVRWSRERRPGKRCMVQQETNTWGSCVAHASCRALCIPRTHQQPPPGKLRAETTASSSMMGLNSRTAPAASPTKAPSTEPQARSSMPWLKFMIIALPK